jgi:hypothetical protein
MIRRIFVTWTMTTMLVAATNARSPTDSPAASYELAALFNEAEACDRAHQELPVSICEEQERRDKLTSEIVALETRMKNGSPEFEAEQHVWESEMSQAIEWQHLELLALKAAPAVTLEKLADGSIKVTGRSAHSDTFIVEASTTLRGITAFRLELLPDPKAKGDAVLSEFRVSATPAEPVIAPNPTARLSPRSETVSLRNASCDLADENGGVSRAIDNRLDTHWMFPLPQKQACAAVFETSQPCGEAERTLLTFSLVQNHGGQCTLDHFRLSGTTKRPPARELPEKIRAILRVEPSERTAAERVEIANYFRPFAKSTRELARQIEAKKSELAKVVPADR